MLSVGCQEWTSNMGCRTKESPNNYAAYTGFTMLVADLKSNKAAGQENLRALRTSALDIAARFWTGDPTLATDLIERIDDPAHLERIAQRAQSKLTQRLLTDAVKEAQGGGIIYALVNDANNVAVTGFKANKIVELRSVGKKRPATRDLFETEELIELQFLELQEQRELKRRNAYGNSQILAAQGSIIAKYLAFKK